MATKKQIEAAWEKASKIRGSNPDLYRKDDFGNVIYKPSHGKQGEKSWEVHHVNPQAKGGSDDPRNLKALQWEKNRELGDKKKKR